MNCAFRASECDESDLQRLADAGIVEEIGAFLRSTVRFSQHSDSSCSSSISSFPTEQSDAVFLGRIHTASLDLLNSTLDTIRLRGGRDPLKVLGT